MKAAIYNPYWDTLGGGERYTACFAKALADCGYDVDIEWKTDISEKIEKRFGIKFRGLNFIESINRGDGYDLCFWLSDGSIPMLKARNNILHFQFPFTNVKGKTLFNKMKLFRINHVVCNSFFTKRFIDKEYGVDSEVIYPPVDVDKFKKKRKQNLILYVGRFSRLTQEKRQDVLIDVFKKLVDLGVKDWRLVLAGGTEVGSKKYLEELKVVAGKYPIEFIESPDFEQIKDLYGKAKIFWSAAGYKINEEKKPKKVEHFGITVVEAMSASVIPVVYSAGGYKEIIADGENGFLWKKKNDLFNKTMEIINKKLSVEKIIESAVESSKIYEYKRFEAEVKQISK